MKFISLNIERSLHLHPRVLPFLQAEQPDILCLQELCLHDIPAIEALMGQKVLYGPMCLHPERMEGGTLVTIGVGLIAKVPLERTAVHYYRGSMVDVPTYRKVPTPDGQSVPAPDAIHQVAVSATVGGIRFMTTHLIVTPKGTATPEQLELADRLLAHAQAEAAQHGTLALAGDFNAPRGRATWQKLNEVFTDNIPPDYTTSLDGDLHRNGPIPYVVDGLFTQNVRARNVRLQNGVSDHMAIVAEVEVA